LQLETEWLRSIRQHAGVLAFCHLTNNYGYTGDWYINNIADLEKGPTLHWFKHAFSPAAVFVNLTDERYTKHLDPHKPGSELLFTLVGVNDYTKASKGKAILKILDSEGKAVHNQQMEVEIPAGMNKYIPVSLKLPGKAGGYLIVNEFYPSGQKEPVISRRYIKVGELREYTYYELELELIFSMLGETSTKEIIINTNPKGFDQHKKVAKAGGKIAGDARNQPEI